MLGIIQFTLMLDFFNSSDIDLTSLPNPDFDAAYAESYQSDFSCVLEDTCIILSYLEDTTCGITYLLIKYADFRFIFIIKSHSFWSSSDTLDYLNNLQPTSIPAVTPRPFNSSLVRSFHFSKLSHSNVLGYRLNTILARTFNTVVCFNYWR